MRSNLFSRKNFENVLPQPPLDFPPLQPPLNDVPSVNKIDDRIGNQTNDLQNATEIKQMSAPFVPKNTGKTTNGLFVTFRIGLTTTTRRIYTTHVEAIFLKPRFDTTTRSIEERTFCAAIMCFAFSIIIILYILC